MHFIFVNNNTEKVWLILDYISLHNWQELQGWTWCIIPAKTYIACCTGSHTYKNGFKPYFQPYNCIKKTKPKLDSRGRYFATLDVCVVGRAKISRIFAGFLTCYWSTWVWQVSRALSVLFSCSLPVYINVWAILIRKA